MWRKISCHFRKTSTQFDFWQSLNVQELIYIVEFWLNLISSFHSFHYWWNNNKEMSITGIYRIVADVKYIVFPNIFIMLHSVIFHFSKTWILCNLLKLDASKAQDAKSTDHAKQCWQHQHLMSKSDWFVEISQIVKLRWISRFYLGEYLLPVRVQWSSTFCECF